MNGMATCGDPDRVDQSVTKGYTITLWSPLAMTSQVWPPLRSGPKLTSDHKFDAMPYRRYARRIGASRRRRRVRIVRSKRRRNTRFRSRGRALWFRKKRFMRRRGFQWRGRGGKKVVPLKYTYCGHINWNLTSNTFAAGPFRLDDPFDPNPNLTGAWNVSSAGYDFWSKYYRYYRVVSAKVKVSCTLFNGGNGTHYPVVAGYSINPSPGTEADPPANATWMQLASRGACCYITDPRTGPAMHRMKSAYWSRNSVEDRSYRDLATLCGSSPDEGNYTRFFLWIATASQQMFTGEPTGSVRFVVHVTQYTEFSGAVGPELDDRVQGRGLWSGGPSLSVSLPKDPAPTGKSAEEEKIAEEEKMD